MPRLKHSRWCAAMTIIVASILLLSGYGGWLAPSQFGTIPALMVLAYPIVAILSTQLCIVWIVRRQWQLAIMTTLALFATWPSLSSNSPVNIHHAEVDSTKIFKVMSYNVAAFSDSLWTDTTHLHPAMQLVLDEDADFVILIQPDTRGLGYDEFKSIAPWLSEIETHYPYRTRSRYDGVEMLSKHPFRCHPLARAEHSYRYFPYVIKSTNRYAFDIQFPDHRQLRIIGAYMASFQLDDDQRRVLDSAIYNVNVPGRLYRKMEHAFTTREHQSKKLRDSLDASPANVILCTDLNDVPQSYAYRTIMGDDLHDSFREGYTGYLSTFNDHRMLFHIDHILYRGTLSATSFKCHRVPHSDHYPIVATFEWR